MSTENGNYVTRAEMQAHLAPMRDDISEIKGDVKSLLASNAGSRAVTRLLQFGVVVGSSMLGAIATLVWLAYP